MESSFSKPNPLRGRNFFFVKRIMKHTDLTLANDFLVLLARTDLHSQVIKGTLISLSLPCLLSKMYMRNSHIHLPQKFTRTAKKERRKVFYKKGVLKNFTKILRKNTTAEVC